MLQKKCDLNKRTLDFAGGVCSYTEKIKLRSSIEIETKFRHPKLEDP